MAIFNKIGGKIKRAFGFKPEGVHKVQRPKLGPYGMREQRFPGYKLQTPINTSLAISAEEHAASAAYPDEPVALPDDGDQYPVGEKLETAQEYLSVESQPWRTVTSSNVERHRWGPSDHRCQVVFKSGRIYEYAGVEPDVYAQFMSATSPGQFVWYVLRQYGYPVKQLSGTHAVTSAAMDIFAGEPYAVPESIQEIQRAAGRKPAEGGLWAGFDSSLGHKPPPAVKPPAQAWMNQSTGGWFK